MMRWFITCKPDRAAARPKSMRRFLLFLPAIASVALAAGPDAHEIVRRSVAADNDNWVRARAYTFIERNDTKRLDGDGQVKSIESKAFDVTMAEGSPYRRLIERDGKPLSADEERKQQEDLRRSIEERRKETPERRSQRLADYEKRRSRNRAMLREVVDAFNFRLAGEESIAGRPAWIIEATPRPDFRPQSREGRMLPKIKGKLWIDQADYQWARVEADVIDTISFGWIVARLAKGARIELEQTRVNDEVWLPSRIRAVASARVGLVKSFNVDSETRYSKFRKFQSDSRIVSAVEAP